MLPSATHRHAFPHATPSPSQALVSIAKPCRASVVHAHAPALVATASTTRLDLGLSARWLARSEQSCARAACHVRLSIFTSSVYHNRLTRLAAHSAERNALESPFLRLPPEIRNRIYFAVLGGHVVHPHFIHPRFGVLIKQARVRWRALTLRGTHIPSACATTSAYIPTDKTSHNAASTEDAATTELLHADFADLDPLYRLPDRPPFTPISRVCRQFHADAALLPFALNVFEFWNTTEMARWLHGRQSPLLPAQKKAVVSILTVDLPESRELAQLQGLRNIYIPSQLWANVKFASKGDSERVLREWLDNIGREAKVVRPEASCPRGELMKIVLEGPG